MEINNNAERKISKPLLAAGILITLAAIAYAIYMITLVPPALKAKSLNNSFFLATAEWVIIIALAAYTMIAAFSPDKLKNLSSVFFLGAFAKAVSLGISIYLKVGITSADLYLFYNDLPIIAAYLLFGIYLSKRNMALIYAVLIFTVSSVFVIQYSSKDFLANIKLIEHYSSGIAEVMISAKAILYTLGVLVLMWVSCIFFPAKAGDKDIIKKSIGWSVILSIVTLGIYAVYWVKSVNDDVAKLEGSEINSSLETAMFFIVPFYAVYWLYTTGRKLAKLSKDADMSALYAIQGLFFLCFFSLALMQSQIHKAIGLNQ